VAYLAINPVGARPDKHFDASVVSPAYTVNHPVLLFDEGHHNAHRVNGRYAPFAKLMTNDGYEVRTHAGAFAPVSLRDAKVLVIVNASGGSNPQVFGINLPFLRKGERAASAFTPAEIQIISEWVRGGGSLLLIADHYPFGTAAAPLAAAFGVTMHGGFAEVANQYPGQDDPGSIEFMRSNGLLFQNVITDGRSLPEKVSRVVSFTGQSLDGPPDAIALLTLPVSAKEFVPPPPNFPPNFEEKPAGDSQGLAFEFGTGRVAVLGEAGMLTAQVEGGKRFGMNVAKENAQFALNVMHWLTRLL
jgi:hypothetical protein